MELHILVMFISVWAIFSSVQELVPQTVAGAKVPLDVFNASNHILQLQQEYVNAIVLLAIWHRLADVFLNVKLDFYLPKFSQWLNLSVYYAPWSLIIWEIVYLVQLLIMHINVLYARKALYLILHLVAAKTVQIEHTLLLHMIKSIKSTKFNVLTVHLIAQNVHMEYVLHALLHLSIKQETAFKTVLRVTS